MATGESVEGCEDGLIADLGIAAASVVGGALVERSGRRARELLGSCSNRTVEQDASRRERAACSQPLRTQTHGGGAHAV